MMVKDFLLQFGVTASFVLGVINLYFNHHIAKRTQFVNTVTSERVKWIAKVRESISTLCSLCDQWIFHPNHSSRPELQKEIEKVKNEIHLMLNPNDIEDQDIERLIARLPSWNNAMTPEDYLKLQATLITSTQSMLKREWDKVKDETVDGNFCKSK
jgi:hypothetical protein